MNNLAIKHDVDKHIFYVKVKGGNAELDYVRHASEFLDLKATNVPSQSRELGVGSKLVEHALNFAKHRDLKVKPTCPFIANFIDKNPSYKSLLVN